MQLFKKEPKVEEINPFDEIIGIHDPVEAKKQQQKRQVEGEKIDNLIHRVFSQSEEGRELLVIWKKTLIMVPTAAPGSDLIQIGINEGTKQFIRNLLITIQKVETGEDNE